MKLKKIKSKVIKLLGKSIFLIFLIIILFNKGYSQKNETGLLRLILDVEFYSKNINMDSCKLNIYFNEDIYGTYYCDTIFELFKGKERIERSFFDLNLPEGDYLIVLENKAFKYPVIFVDVPIKKNKYSFLPIQWFEINKLIKKESNIVIVNYSKNLKRYRDLTQ